MLCTGGREGAQNRILRDLCVSFHVRVSLHVPDSPDSFLPPHHGRIFLDRGGVIAFRKLELRWCAWGSRDPLLGGSREMLDDDLNSSCGLLLQLHHVHGRIIFPDLISFSHHWRPRERLPALRKHRYVGLTVPSVGTREPICDSVLLWWVRIDDEPPHRWFAVFGWSLYSVPDGFGYIGAPDRLDMGVFAGIGRRVHKDGASRSSPPRSTDRPVARVPDGCVLDSGVQRSNSASAPERGVCFHSLGIGWPHDDLSYCVHFRG